MEPIEYDYFNPDDRHKFISHHQLHIPTGDGYELIILTGLVLIDQKGESASRWINRQINLKIPIPDIPEFQVFKLKNWTPFVTINAIWNGGVSNNNGHAVDGFRILNPDSPHGESVTVQADIAIRNGDAWLYKIGYHVSLKGEYTGEVIGD